LIDSDVDVVLMASPPYFRPLHIETAINAGKHIFTEKPMAVDAPGVRRVIASAEKAKEKGLSVVSGLCWRYHVPKRETFSRVLDGAVGTVQSVYNTFNTGTLWLREVDPEWTEMQKKAHNWYYHNWLSGDHIVEQAVHSIDMMSWVYGDVTPLSATGTGGRQVRIEPEYGNIYDHFAVVYEYENGAKGFHFSRQHKDVANSYGVDISGTDGRCVVDVIRNRHNIEAGKAWKWSYRGDGNDMYQQEHDELFASIRNNQPINDGKIMTQSTMLAIMGRMVAYTGQKITYEEALNSKETLGPEKVDIDTVFEDAPVAKPGITKFI
jgi:predicted dehydrogenase